MVNLESPENNPQLKIIKKRSNNWVLSCEIFLSKMFSLIDFVLYNIMAVLFTELCFFLTSKNHFLSLQVNYK